MALEMARSFSGISLPNAYLKIDMMVISSLGGGVVVTLGVYASKAARDAMEASLTPPDICSFPYSSDAGIAWAYEQIKLMPEYSGAIDV